MLFLFNLAGYRLFFHYIQKKADVQYELSLNNNVYDESQMITLKVDLNMPYVADNTQFERVDGEITVDGKIFKYVKRKIHNGQLVLLCLPDEKKTKLRSSREEYFFYANNLLSNSSAKQSTPKAPLVKNISTDYDQIFLLPTPGCLPSIIHHHFAIDDRLFSSSSPDLPAQPPELL
jgi:hypothetical protein